MFLLPRFKLLDDRPLQNRSPSWPLHDCDPLSIKELGLPVLHRHTLGNICSSNSKYIKQLCWPPFTDSKQSDRLTLKSFYSFRKFNWQFSTSINPATMSPSRDIQHATSNEFGDLNLSITGLGIEYPPYKLEPEALDTICQRHYPDSPAFVPNPSPLSPSNITDQPNPPV